MNNHLIVLQFDFLPNVRNRLSQARLESCLCSALRRKQRYAQYRSPVHFRYLHGKLNRIARIECHCYVTYTNPRPKLMRVCHPGNQLGVVLPEVTNEVAEGIVLRREVLDHR